MPIIYPGGVTSLIWLEALHFAFVISLGSADQRPQISKQLLACILGRVNTFKVWVSLLSLGHDLPSQVIITRESFTTSNILEYPHIQLSLFICGELVVRVVEIDKVNY